MNRPFEISLLILATIAALTTNHRAAAQYAAEVLSYDAGTTPAVEFGSNLPYDIAQAALGQPESFTGEGSFPSVVSPFNPPYLRNEIVSIGLAGQITLRLSHFAVPQAGGPEIGVFANIALSDTQYPDGVAGDPDGVFGIDYATVEVSEDGLSWTSLGNMKFDIPTNAYTDVTSPFASSPGSTLADFQQPFTGALNDFTGLPYYDAGGNDILDLLDGSGGGTWLDISGTGLAEVGYIRFSIVNGFDMITTLNFELDAVSVSHAAIGRLTVPEPASIALGGLVMAALVLAGRRRSAADGR